MTREEIKEQLDEIIRQYDDEEIDRADYVQKIMELITSAQGEVDKD